MAGSIYQIITDKGVYVGKWNDETIGFMSRHHLPRALPWLDVAKDAWEVEWRNSLLKFGWDNGKYFHSIQQWPESTIIANLKNSFQKLKTSANPNFSVDQFWKDITLYWWKQGHDRDIAEALCIMLASKKGEGNVLNTQIDFLTRSFRGWNVEELLNVDELNRRAFAANKNLFNINLWVSITADDVDKELSDLFDKVGLKRVNLFGNQKFIDALNKAVTENTIKRIIEELKSIRAEVAQSKLPGKTAVKNALNDTIKQIENSKDSSYKQVVSIVKEGLKRARKQGNVLKLLEKQTSCSANQFIEMLRTWLQNTDLEDILTSGDIIQYGDESSMGGTYKRMFSKHIQEKVFNPIVTNPYREELNRTRIEFSQENNVAFNKRIYRPNFSTNSTETLKSKTKNNPSITNWVFVQENWDYIYDEQVKLWQHIHLKDYSLEDIIPDGEYVEDFKDIKYF